MNYEDLMMNALDGTITPSERATLNTWFAQHPDERAAFEHMLAVDIALKEAEPIAPPAAFTQRVLAQTRAMPIVRPIKRSQVAVVVVGNSLLMALSWMVIVAAVIGFGALAAQAPIMQPVFAFVRAIFTLVSDVLRALGSTTRALSGQPIVWIAIVAAMALVVAWFSVVARVFLPQRRFTYAQL